ncbi:hypothetical protein [Winogradskyella sp.]|uniref:hypothetical protein n=1 Tax=Winogradskyella sp. TaxID=1883156 RepID=UPI001B01BFBB|nr:hypothetical protein [Winogradskyella sp.]MBO6881450.1 hypothetical protein [Winogradskyella sp.]
MQEEQNKSFFYQYIWGEWLDDAREWNKPETFFKKIDYDVILNGSLSINDKAVYLAILRYISFTKTYKTKIASSQIEDITGIIQQNQTKSIKKLMDVGVISVFGSRFENTFLLTKEPKTFLPIKLEQFEGIKYYRKNYIRRLTGIMLSNGNNQIPTYRTCLKKMGKLTVRELQKIKSIYNGEYEFDDIDIENYKRL